jgi:hypothetical protein
MPTDKAAEWAADHIAAIDDATTVEDLDLVISGGAKAMVKLQRDRPELHEMVTNTYDARRAVLAREVKPDADAGEGYADD